MKKNLLIFSLGLGLLLLSCKKEKNNPEPGTKSNGDDVIATASRQAKDDIVSWTQSEGADVVISLTNILEINDEPISGAMPRVSASSYYKKPGKIYKRKAKAFRRVFIPHKNKAFRTTSDDERFDFSANVGTYTFVKADSTWNFDASPTDKIVMLFPSDTTSDVNDAKLTIFNYADIAHTDGPETSYLPTTIDAELSIGATKYVDVNFSALYNSNGVPTSLEYTLYLKPFTNTLKYTEGGSTVTISTAIAKDGEAFDVLSTAGTITFYDIDKDSVISFSGHTQYRRLKLSGSVNVAALSQEEETTGSISVASYNTNINIDIIDNQDSQIIGHIDFFDNAGVADIQVRFPDNSTKPASVYFDPILDELETFITSVE